MRKTALLLLTLLLLVSLACQNQPQNQAGNLSQARQTIADYAIHCNQIEKENAQIKAWINGIVKDLQVVRDMDGLKIVIEKYGIDKAK